MRYRFEAMRIAGQTAEYVPGATNWSHAIPTEAEHKKMRNSIQKFESLKGAPVRFNRLA